MTRVRCWTVLTMAVVLGGVLAAAAEAQPPEGARRGLRSGLTRGSLIGLLRREQVQKELKLNEEQTAKVNKLVEELGAQMRDQFTELQQIEDRAERWAKMSEMSDQTDQKVREQLRDVLEREQMMRLYQIRMQVRPAVDSLSNEFVARKLELSDEQKPKLAEIKKEAQAKLIELFGAMRDAGDDQRSEMIEKYRQLRRDADEKALAVLTDEQKNAFEEMKGEKFELQRD